MTRLNLAEAQRLGLIPKQKKKRLTPLRITKAHWDARKIHGGVLFIIPENMSSLNVWKNWHWAKQQDYKNYLTYNLGMLALTVGRPEFEKARVEIVHFHRVCRCRDADNMTPKFLLDALRYAGVIVDDNADVLELPEPRFEIDREAWRTEVYVYERD